jgi:hypothetical protein
VHTKQARCVSSALAASSSRRRESSRTISRRTSRVGSGGLRARRGGRSFDNRLAVVFRGRPSASIAASCDIGTDSPVWNRSNISPRCFCGTP